MRTFYASLGIANEILMLIVKAKNVESIETLNTLPMNLDCIQSQVAHNVHVNAILTSNATTWFCELKSLGF